MVRDSKGYSEVATFAELLTMADVEGFSITADSYIVSPGRFEGEHVSALYWDDVYMIGDAGDEYTVGESHAVSWYELEESDAVRCGQPSDNVRTFARMEYTGQGFVYLRYYPCATRDDVDELNNARNADRADADVWGAADDPNDDDARTAKRINLTVAQVRSANDAIARAGLNTGEPGTGEVAFLILATIVVLVATAFAYASLLVVIALAQTFAGGF